MFAVYYVTFNHHYALETPITYDHNDKVDLLYVWWLLKKRSEKKKKKVTIGWLQVVTGLVFWMHQFWQNVLVPIALKLRHVGLLPRCIRTGMFHHNTTVDKYTEVTPIT